MSRSTEQYPQSFPYPQQNNTVHFSDPWLTGRAVNPTSAPYGSLTSTTMAPSNDLTSYTSKPTMRQNSVSQSFDPLAMSMPMTTRALSSQMNYGTADVFSSSQFPATYADQQSTASPTTGVAVTAAPSYNMGTYGSYEQPSARNLYAYPSAFSVTTPERRLSHPNDSSNALADLPQDLLRQRQGSLIDYNTRGSIDYTTRGSMPNPLYASAETLDSARGMMALSHGRYPIPNNHRNSSSASSSSYYPGSTGSSISSGSSYPYAAAANGGTIDQTVAEISGMGDIYDPRPSLPRPVNMAHNAYCPHQSNPQQSMMGTFNSRVQNTTSKKHRCKVCDKRFTRPSSLQTHMYSHTGEKPFACDVAGCGKHFSVVSNLRRHRKVHKELAENSNADGMSVSAGDSPMSM